MLRLRTNVTSSPTISRRSWSATSATARDLGTTCAEQRDDLVDADLFTGEHAVEHLADARRRARRGRRAGAAAASGGSRSSRPGDHAVVAREAFEVGRDQHRGAHVGMQPLVGSRTYSG